jgi:RNase P subunit RPR2
METIDKKQQQQYKDFFEHISYLYHTHCCEGKTTDKEFIQMFEDVMKQKDIDKLISNLY